MAEAPLFSLPKPHPLKPRTLEYIAQEAELDELTRKQRRLFVLIGWMLVAHVTRVVCNRDSNGSVIIRKSHKNSFWFKLKVVEKRI